MFVLKNLRLSDPESVTQWERIVPFVREIPQKPDRVLFHSSFDTSKEVAGFRSVTPKSMGFLLVASEDEIRLMENGGKEVVSTIYKVSHDYPFVIRDIDVMDIENEAPETFTERIKAAFSRLTNYNAMIPSTEELKDLANFLENSERTIVS